MSTRDWAVASNVDIPARAALDAERLTRQAAYLLWAPTDIRAALCVAHGPCLIPLALDRGNHVFITSPQTAWMDSMQQSARGSHQPTLISIPYEERWSAEQVDTAFVFGSPLDPHNLAQDITQAVRVLRPGGRVLIGVETGWGMVPVGVRHGRIIARVRAGIAAVRLARKILNDLHCNLRDVVNIFPDLWRPTLLAPVRSSAVTKRLALRHAGYRLSALSALVAPAGGVFIPDLFPPAVFLVAEASQ